MYKDIFEQHLEKFLKSHSISFNISTSYSDYEDFQYQTALPLSLKKIKNDFDPNELASFLKSNYSEFYEKIEVTGKGFISVKFNILNFEESQHFKKKVIVDYCGVNVAKQMHIGHIRSMFIGDYVARLHQKAGDEVHIFNHIGDWGNQFGYLIAYIEKNKLENELNNKNLTDYYKKAYSLYKESPHFAQISDLTAQKLHQYDEKTIQLWKKLVNISLEQAEETFKEMNLLMNLSHTQGESFYAPLCKDILSILIDKKLAIQENDGSIVAFFENKSPLILQKSNGNYLYALYDLAALKWRNDNLSPDKIIYVVDKRQTLHFEQVFELAKKSKFVADSVDLIHLGFGTVLGEDKKPLKTKEGKSLYLDDLLDQGKAILLQSKHYDDMQQHVKEEILLKTIIGGMKFYDLKFNKTQDYIFDWKHVLNFSGSSAPYLQNAIVRIDSIFCKKYGVNYEAIDFNINEFSYDNFENNIIFNCQKLTEMIFENSHLYHSQTLTNQAMKICQLFHAYYEKEKIIGSDNENKKLSILSFIDQSLKKFSEIMGISWYDCQQKFLNQPKRIVIK